MFQTNETDRRKLSVIHRPFVSSVTVYVTRSVAEKVRAANLSPQTQCCNSLRHYTTVILCLNRKNHRRFSIISENFHLSTVVLWASTSWKSSTISMLVDCLDLNKPFSILKFTGKKAQRKTQSGKKIKFFLTQIKHHENRRLAHDLW